MTQPPVYAYCPRCDRAFSAFDSRVAIHAMEVHMKKAHPDYYTTMYPPPDER